MRINFKVNKIFIYQTDIHGQTPFCPLDIFPQRGEDRDRGLF